MKHQDDIWRVLHMACDGIAMLRRRYRDVKVRLEVEQVANPARKTSPEEQEALRAAADERDLVQREVDGGFPLLHEQAAVGLWSSLEGLVKNFCAAWLDHREEAWRIEAVAKLRIRLGDYNSLDPADRGLWVVGLLEREVGLQRAGVDRFEALLGVFGFDGPVEEEFRKGLWELFHVRNVIVHRRGIADRRLVEACPWLNLAPGDRIKVSHDMWGRYNRGVDGYGYVVIQRVRHFFIPEVPAWKEWTPPQSRP